MEKKAPPNIISKRINAVSIEFVPVSEEIQKINSNSIKGIMIAALQRHANHALKGNGSSDFLYSETGISSCKVFINAL
jgi:hypothetical protein